AAGEVEPCKAEPEAEHMVHPVGVVKLEDHRADDVVDAWADAPGAQDADGDLLRFEEDLHPWSGLLECTRSPLRRASRMLDIPENVGIIRHERRGTRETQRRWDFGWAENGDMRAQRGIHQ